MKIADIEGNPCQMENYRYTYVDEKNKRVFKILCDPTPEGCGSKNYNE